MQAACWLLSPPSTPTLSLLLVTDPPCGFPCATAVKPTVKEDLVKKVNNNLNITSAVFCNSETPSLYSYFFFSFTSPGQPISSSNRQNGKQTAATLIVTHQTTEKRHSKYGQMSAGRGTIVYGFFDSLLCYYRVICVAE